LFNEVKWNNEIAITKAVVLRLCTLICHKISEICMQVKQNKVAFLKPGGDITLVCHIMFVSFIYYTLAITILRLHLLYPISMFMQISGMVPQ